MSNELVPIEQAAAQLPALLRQRQQAGVTTTKHFEEGIRDAFPLLSIKGKVWRARISGQETPFIDPNTKQPIPYIDVILVNASRTLSKAFYVKGYAEGDLNPPDCWSMDSIRPDPSVAQKVSPTCAACPMNQFGSKITENGKAAKACQDARRVAVVMPHYLGAKEPLLLMMRVPQSSLKNLKGYAQLLDKHGFEPGACITRMAFDYNEAFPKIIFNFVAPLTDAQYAQVVELAEAETTAAMLLAPDFETAPSTTPKQADTVAGVVPQQGPVLADPSIINTTTPNAAVVGGSPINMEGMIELPDGRLYDPLTKTFHDKPAPAPVVQAVASTVIELPDGKLFDTATGQYVERTQPAVQMPELDPDTMQLPDGKFYNRKQNAFVTGPEKGAPAATAAPQTTRKRRTKAEIEADNAKAQQQAVTAQVQTGLTQAVDPTPLEQTINAAKAADIVAAAQHNAAAANGSAAGAETASVSPQVVSAPQDLEAILKGLVPPKT